MRQQYKILVACEESQAVCKAFRERGFIAYSCDILPCSGGYPEWHLKCDVREVINSNWKFNMMIAFPPCTHLAVSGAAHFAKKIQLQKEALEFVTFLMNAPIERIAIENPISIISSRIRKPDQIIQPFYFGDPVPKRTCLWLKNLPKLIHSSTDNLFEERTFVEPHFLYYNSKKNKSGKSRYSVFGKMGKGKGHERSKTFPGIAEAMAEQWGKALLEGYHE